MCKEPHLWIFQISLACSSTSPSCLWTLGNLRTVWELDLELRESRQWRWWQAHLVPNANVLDWDVESDSLWNIMKYHEISLSLLHHSYHSYDSYDLIRMNSEIFSLIGFVPTMAKPGNPSAEHPSRSPHSRDLPWGWFVRFPAMRNVQCKAVELQTFCLFLQNGSQCSSHKVTKSWGNDTKSWQDCRPIFKSLAESSQKVVKWTKILAFKRLQTKPGATWSPAQKWFFLRLTKLTKWQNVTKITPINCTIPRAVL